MPGDLSQDEVLRYARQLILPEIGFDGQRRLKKAAVLLVGTGGLGSPIALYLAAAGVGRIGLVDHDVVEASNLQRQVVHSTHSIGTPKVESARRQLLALNPHIQVDAFHTQFSAANAEQIAAPYDVLVDGSDNFATRYLLNDLAVLSGKPYVYGSVFRFEGQVSVFHAARGPCYRCLFTAPPPPASVPPSAAAGVLGVLPGTIGTLQAAEVIKLICGAGDPLIGRLLLYDALEASFQTVQLRKNPRCVLCSEHPTLTCLADYEQFCGQPVLSQPPVDFNPALEIEPARLAELLRSGTALQVVDVREPNELAISAFPFALNLPLGELAQCVGRLQAGILTITLSRNGARSLQAVGILKAAGVAEVLSLRGGLNAWARQVDPEMYQY